MSANLAPSPMTSSRRWDLPSLEPPEYPGRRILEAHQYGPALWMRAEARDTESTQPGESTSSQEVSWYRYEFISQQRRWRVTYLGVRRPEFVQRSTDEIGSALEKIAEGSEPPNTKVGLCLSILHSLAWLQDPMTPELRRTAMGLLSSYESQVEAHMRVRLETLMAEMASGSRLTDAQRREYRNLAHHFSEDH